MKVWVVTQQGIYRHMIMGIYDSWDATIQRALDCARDDSDTYHDYFVGTAQLNSAIDDIDDLGVYTNRENKRWRYGNNIKHIIGTGVKHD